MIYSCLCYLPARLATHLATHGSATTPEWRPALTKRTLHPFHGHTPLRSLTSCRPHVPTQPHSHAREDGLYAIHGAVEKNVIERDFFRHLDTQAARVHQQLLTTGTAALTATDREIWAMFIVSLMMRTPGKVEEIRREGEKALLAELERDSAEYDALRGVNTLATLLEFAKTFIPKLSTDFSAISLPALVQSPKLNDALNASDWKVLSAPRSSSKMLAIGDRPVIYNGTMATSFLISLPISPTQIFFAFNKPKTDTNLDAVSWVRIVRNLNQAAASAASKYVYATDSSEEHIVRAHLKP